MVIQVQPHDLAPFYRTAREGYEACISNPENGYLQAEAPIPLSDIAVRHGEVRVAFSSATAGAYQWEVHLWLYVQDKYFGQYAALMDAAGELLEDNLVFY
jgi:hypothetical protein